MLLYRVYYILDCSVSTFTEITLFWSVFTGKIVLYCVSESFPHNSSSVEIFLVSSIKQIFTLHQVIVKNSCRAGHVTGSVCRVDLGVVSLNPSLGVEIT